MVQDPHSEGEEVVAIPIPASAQSPSGNGRESLEQAAKYQTLIHDLELHQAELVSQNEELLKTQLHLENSRNKYLALYELAPLSYFTIDPKGYILTVNRAGCSILAADRESLYKQAFPKFLIGESADVFYLHQRKVFQTNTRQTCELSLKNTTGNPFWVRLESQTEVDETGATNMLTAVMDVTPMKKLKEDMQLAKTRAEHALQVKEQFLANMSHEIRTPLSGVISLTEILLEMDISDEMREYLDLMAYSSDALLGIIDDILDLAKIEAGMLVLKEQPFDLRDCLVEICALMEPKLKEKELPWTLIIGADVQTRLLGDAGRLRQILLNLVGNAIKFTHRGEIQINIRLISRKDQCQSLRFEIIDTGIGIPLSRQELLFQPFTQLDGSSIRSYGGTGLGLNISKQLVEAMGGTIGLESEPGAGSTFFFTLPLKVAEGIEHPVKETPANPTPAKEQPLRTREQKILLVEDDAVNRLATQKRIEEMGFDCRVAENGASALHAIQKENFHLILMDCLMPGLDGYETTRSIRKLEGNGRHTPILALTAHVLEGNRARCLRSGMDGFLAKPLKKIVLQEAVKTYLTPD